jgi:N-methylhydantoinase B
VRFAPYGLYGGKPGGRSANFLDPYGTNQLLPAKVKHRPIKRGEVIRHLLAGGGGFGWAFEREVARVVRDVRDGKVSAASARRDYGVAIDPETYAVDAAATARLRGDLRRQAPAVPPLFTQ